jgi:hypothetical protein
MFANMGYKYQLHSLKWSNSTTLSHFFKEYVLFLFAPLETFLSPLSGFIAVFFSPFFRFIATLPPIYRHFSILSPIYRHFLNFVGDKKDSRIAWLIHLPTIVFSGAPTRVIANPL